MKWIDYREKLGIGFDDEKKFQMLSTKLQNYVEACVGSYYNSTSYLRYCDKVGERYGTYYTFAFSLKQSLAKSESIKELLSKYTAFYLTYIKTNNSDYNCISKNDILKFLTDSLTSLNIQFETLTDEDGVFIFPKGAKELDISLVSQPLEWLESYPKVRIEFIDAIKSFDGLTDKNASEVADKFRKALERFFQEFFNKQKTLENLISDYGTYLKNQGLPAELSNNFVTLVKNYTNFMNGYAKHHNKATKNSLEYIMYETGNIIRLLITLKQNENNKTC